MICAHCGMDGHERKDCQWAKRSDEELQKEAKRRKEKSDTLET